MRNIKALLIAGVAGLLLSGTASAQLSDRVNNPTTFKVGTRPVQGNLAVSLGVGKRDVQNWAGTAPSAQTADLREFSGLPMTHLKYYWSDKFVIILGLKGESTKETFKGDIDPEVNSPGNVANGQISQETKKVDSRYLLAPGFEQHFLSSNILDVFIRASVPIGFVTDINIDDDEYNNGDYNFFSAKRRSMLIGLDCGVGVQMFIADLPFALGAETGVVGYGYYRNKTKYEVESSAGGTVVSQEFYQVDGDATKYKSLSSRTFEIQPSFRFSFSYFFKR